MGIERRKYKRVDASSIIWYEITDMKKMQTGEMHVDIGKTQRSVDISLGGARIFTDAAIEPDKVLCGIWSKGRGAKLEDVAGLKVEGQGGRVGAASQVPGSLRTYTRFRG